MLHLGYEIWIADSRKQRINEYNVRVEGDDGKTIVCYIASESGKKFSICWKDHNGPQAHHTSMKAFVDGSPAGKTHCQPGGAGKRAGLRATSADTYHPFQFANLQTTDEDDSPWGGPGGAPLEKLGTIELRVVHVHPHVRLHAFRPNVFAGVERVHERSKKAGSHCVTLGRAKPFKNPHRSRVSTTPLNKRAGPAVTFVFRYRPAAILQAEDIMPAAAAGAETGQGAPAQDRKTRVKSKPQRGSRASNVGAAEVKPVHVKREGRRSVAHVRHPSNDVIELTDDEEDARHRVKREPGTRVKTQYDPNDVIDLTLD